LNFDIAFSLLNRFSRESLEHYLDSVVINSSPEPARFGDVADPWQRELLAPQIPALEWLAGLNPSYTGPQRFLSILARGHDKSSLEGRFCNWLLAYSRRLINGSVIAKDRDQARIILDSAKKEAALNPWLNAHLTFGKNEITGPSGRIQIIPADAGSAFGLQDNFYIVDEITHWKPGVGEEMWQAISSGFGKVSPTVVMVITNAWVIGSWQHELVIKTAMTDPTFWQVFYRQGRLASWLKPEILDRDRKMLPGAVARRVFDNVPIDPVVESGYLDPDDVRACQSDAVVPHVSRMPGYRYVVGVDYGATRDRNAMCVLHLEPDGRVIVDLLEVWQGTPSARIQVEAVEKWVQTQIENYRPSALVFDPYQMEGTCQKFERANKNVIRFNSRGGSGNMELAMHLRGLIANKRLQWKPSAGRLDTETFADELIALVTKVMPYGWRLDHTAAMHDDRAVAVGMAATEAVKFSYMGEGPQSGQSIDVPKVVPFGEFTPRQNPLLRPILRP
jgi:phage terminase large subunit-like protein